MIILVSKSDGEQSTDEVIDWLFFKNQEHVRINGSDFLESCFSVTLAKGFKKYNIHNSINIKNLFNVKKTGEACGFVVGMMTPLTSVKKIYLISEVRRKTLQMLP